MNERILVIEDESELCMTLGHRLRSEGYAVDFEHDGLDGLEKATNTPFDLIILDIMLPRRGGLDICRDLRRAGVETPILFLTARGQTVEKIIGLRVGGDDYVTKPFDSHELMARVEVLLRRSAGKTALPRVDPEICRIGDVAVELRSGRVSRDGKPIELTAREFQLLRFLIEHRGGVVTREQLLKEVWGHEPGTVTRTVDVHISSLRQKLEHTPRHPDYLCTVAGIGYKLRE
jgi:two-component system, OmpR family, alkaline phosphatase synthesis response regulator PhoP